MRNRYRYPVRDIVDVVDGDTLRVVIDRGWDDSKSFLLRLSAIDAPESRTRRDPLEREAGGLVKSVLAAELAKYDDFDMVSLEKDKYHGRALGELECFAAGKARPLGIAEWLLKHSFVRPYDGKRRYPWPATHLKAIIALARDRLGSVVNLVLAVVLLSGCTLELPELPRFGDQTEPIPPPNSGGPNPPPEPDWPEPPAGYVPPSNLAIRAVPGQPFKIEISYDKGVRVGDMGTHLFEDGVSLGQVPNAFGARYVAIWPTPLEPGVHRYRVNYVGVDGTVYEGTNTVTFEVTGPLTIEWDAPTTNADGTLLSDLKGYLVILNDKELPTVHADTRATVPEAPSGDELSVKAVDTSGNRSRPSNIIRVP